MDTDIQASEQSAEVLAPAVKNIVLLGIMGSGKTAIGWQLARIMGFGFLDVDQWIEQKLGKPIHQIFAEAGEAAFRRYEHEAIVEISGVRNHVVSVGGGAVLDDDNWKIIKEMGVSVWLNTPPAEIARRLVMKPDELSRRPLLSDVVNASSKDERFKLLHDRIASLIQHRQQRYQEAQIEVSHSYSTPEAAAKLIKDKLAMSGLLNRSGSVSKNLV